MRFQLVLLVFISIFEIALAYSTIEPGIACERNCTADPENKVCYYHFNVEQYTTLNAACSLCRPNVTNYVSNDCKCVIADGVERSFVSTNRMLPGPAIYVCKGDKVVVDVTNRLQSEGTTVHWHGIHQMGTQYYDGVPYVTQCPIDPFTTFRYQWYAQEAGTFFWHSHSGLQHYNAGSLVVRESYATDPHSHLFDYDSWEHTILIQDWHHLQSDEYWPGNIYNNTGQNPSNILINGRGFYQYQNGGKTLDNFAYFNVTSGSRYRFRLINAFSSSCAAKFTIQGHNITLIAVDAKPVEPVVATSITSLTGQRFDFILEASENVDSYWIQIVAGSGCGPQKLQQLAVLRYDGASDLPSSITPTYESPLIEGKMINPLDRLCYNDRTDAVCLNQLNNMNKNVGDILKAKPDVTLYLPFEIVAIKELESFFKPDTYNRFFVLAGGLTDMVFTSTVNNVSFIAPGPPLISQYDDIDPNKICNSKTCTDKYCFCANVERVPLNSIVDVVVGHVVNASMGVGYHPFHLHGNSFYLLASGTAEDLGVNTVSMDTVKNALDSGLIKLRSDELEKGYPPSIDTVPVASNGFAVLRFVANNPGVWFFHCHIASHAVSGMAVVIWVGEMNDLPPVPKGFPTCGSFTPEVELH